MNQALGRCVFLMLPSITLTACGGGGGGGSSGIPTPPVASLASISLSPLSLSLAPGSTSALVVIGTYSDGSTKSLAASGELFRSSSATIATVATDGTVTVASAAAVGASATISATDSATGLATAASASTVVTVVAAASGTAPTSTSSSAATATAQNNAKCTAIEPFYWEIGDASGTLASGSPTATGGTAVAASSRMLIASASKWIYGMYVVQKRGGAANLTAADVRFLTFNSGYTYMGSDTQSATCTAPASGADSINYCLTLPSSTAAGASNSSQNPATVGVFDYDAGHEENHAGQFQPELNALDTSDLGTAIAAGLGVGGITLRYTQPLLAGGVFASADDYATMLRAILGGQLGMLQALGTHPVCAWSTGSGCAATYSPLFTEHWHYSITHWVEDDPNVGDGAFSSPGAFGFYPWIESNRKYYGVISRTTPTGTGTQNGLASALCGRALRAAWETGIAQ